MSAPSKVQFFSLQGITCAGCVRSVDKALLNLQQQQPELESFSINFADRTAIISGNLADDQVITAIRNAGYDASLVESEQDREQIEQAEQQYLKVTLYRSIAALTTGAAMMLLQMSGVIAALSTISGQLQALVMALVSAAIMYFCAAKIYRGAWQSLKTLAFNMDILIALGTLSAWIYSAVLLLIMSFSLQVVPASAQHLYFEAAVVILGFILLGQSLEARVRGSTARAVQSLINMQPKLAWRQDKQGEFVQVPVQLLIPGDLVLVKPGEAIPVDGVVVAGSSAVDESMISGESVAVAKVLGDAVIGSTVNASGSMTFKVTQVGSHTMLAQIIAQVRRAQNSKPALGRLADKIAAVFVPIVLVIALFTALIWWWYAPVGNWSYVLTATMTVLIVACPCALGLATPMSTMVGVGLAARRGILIQNGDALQVAEDLTTIVLDKTGTITAGKPSVTDSLFLRQDVDQSQLYNWLLQIEQKSEHPLAQALVDFASQQDVDSAETPSLTDFNSVTSAGVSANFAGVEVKVGSLTWLAQGLSEGSPSTSRAVDESG